MGNVRTVLAYCLLAALLATVLVLLEPPQALRGTGEFAIAVEGPEGTVWNDTVAVEDATPLEVLLGAGRAGDFTVGVRGSGASAYVHAIAGHGESGAGGWCYAVERGEQHLSPATGAGVFALKPGDAVRWYWADDGCLPFT